MVRFALEKSSNVKLRKVVTYAHNQHKPPTKKEFWMRKFVEFCKRTDLHGYKYIVMEDLNYIERSCWALAVLISIALAAYFVITAYKWYARNPIVTVIESTQGAIWDVPFPAVTICDLNIVSKKAAHDLAYNLTLPANVTADFVFKAFRLVPLLHSTFKANDIEKTQLQQLQDILDLNNISMADLFRMLSPASPCSRLIQKCMWKNTVYSCGELFTQIFTVLSVCCTFNYFAVDDKKRTKLESTPRRVASCGYQTALTVLLYTNLDDYYSAGVASQGLLVIIDNAYNIPDLDSPVRMVNPSNEVLVALSPERTYTTSGIKAFSPQERQCYYSDEIKIGSFRQYSFHNCIAYQKVQLLKKTCNCLPLYFPSEDGLRICNFRDMTCIEKIFSKEEYITHNVTERNTNDLKCLPECEHYNYPLEVALGNLADIVFVNDLPFFDNVALQNRSLLNVFFNDLVSTRYRRDVYLNWQNLLAAFGGLLSLMLGFTLISGYDMILFFTVRVAYTSCTENRDDKAGNKIHVEANHRKDTWIFPEYQGVYDKHRNDYYEYNRY